MNDGDWAGAEAKARSHWGAITFAELRSLGFSTIAIRWALKTRRLVRLFRRAYRFTVVAACWQQLAWLATQFGGSGSALSHATAASIWRLNGFESARSPIHVSLPTRRKLRLPKTQFLVHRPTCTFDPLTVDGFRVTRLARTIVDIAETLTDLQLEILLDAAQHRFSLLPDTLAAEIPLHRKQATPGLARLIRILAVRQGVTTESALETQFRARLRARGLPPPEFQADLEDEHGFITRADAAWRDHLVALHVDSFRWHATRAQFDRDAQQRRRLAAARWLNLAVTEADLESDEWLDQLGQILARRSAQQDLFRAPEVF